MEVEKVFRPGSLGSLRNDRSAGREAERKFQPLFETDISMGN